MKNALRALLLAFGAAAVAGSANAFIFDPYYRETGAAPVGTFFRTPTYLPAGGPEAQAMAAQLANDYWFLNWGFGTGPTLHGWLYLDRTMPEWSATLPPQNATLIGMYDIVRFRNDACDPERAYREPVPGSKFIWPHQGVQGTYNVDSTYLRWVCRVHLDNGDPTFAPYTAFSDATDDGLPFYYTESENASLTNGWDQRVVGKPIWFTKYLAPILNLRPKASGGVYIGYYYMDCFLAEYRIYGSTASVTVLDGYRMGCQNAYAPK